MNDISAEQAVVLYRIYESTWRNMDRENNLVNQRITWSLTMTVGFLAAETFLLSQVFRIADTTERSDIFIVSSFIACAVLSALATYICYRVQRGVNGAFDQIHQLELKYAEYELEFETAMSLPRPYGRGVASFRGHSAARIFPLAMTGVWLVFCLAQAYAAVHFASLL